MKKRLQTALFIFLIAAICSLNGGKAQGASEIPEKIQRNWALPDCGRNEEAVILSKHFYLKFTKADMALLPAALEGEKSDYWMLDLDGADVPARLEEDGVLTIGTSAKGASQKSKWDDLKLDSTAEYTGCVTTPKIVPKVLERLMRYIDRIKEQCTVSVTNECAGVLFKLADADNNNKLSDKEIRKGVASAMLFAELAEKETLTKKEGETVVKNSATPGGQIAEALLATYDANKSKNLDYNEILADFKAPSLPVVKETLLKAGNILPSFKVVALALD
ncbi:MAG: hypothetical protein ACAH80_08260 [Alphaproteobacteria bacterium]